MSTPKKRDGLNRLKIDERHLEAFGKDGYSDQLVEEFNIFNIEGLLFDLRRKHGKSTEGAGKVKLGEILDRPVSIEANPIYGRPAVGAFKALQVIFLKLTEEGWPYSNKISFTKREFERLRGNSWGSYQARRTYYDIMQLQTCLIHCTRKEKTTNNWEYGIFSIITKSAFTGSGANLENVSRFTIHIDEGIIDSLNAFHLARFNWYRLRQLIDNPIATIMYKRFYQWGASLMDNRSTKQTFDRLEKDYEDACRQWFGGLKPMRYKSDIIKDQLGRHIDLFHETRLGRITVEKRKKGQGFKLVFKPRKGFFDDYQHLYIDPWQKPPLPIRRSADAKNIQEPLQLVEYFHKQLGRTLGRAAFQEGS